MSFCLGLVYLRSKGFVSKELAYNDNEFVEILRLIISKQVLEDAVWDNLAIKEHVH